MFKNINMIRYVNIITNFIEKSTIDYKNQVLPEKEEKGKNPENVCKSIQFKKESDVL